MLPSFLLYVAFSGWSAAWNANLLLLENYPFNGKENEGISLAVGDFNYLS